MSQIYDIVINIDFTYESNITKLKIQLLDLN